MEGRIEFLDGRVALHHGDCLAILRAMPDCSVDSCVTDPPYHLTSIVKRFGGSNAAPAKIGKTGAYARASTGFMGKHWDGGDIAFQPELWAEVLRVLKPGGYLIAFSGTRTYHRMAVAIEDAGFDIRDQLGWLYGSGFPKSLDISKAVDKAAGAVRAVTPSSLMATGTEVGAISKNRRCDACGKPHASANPCTCPRDDGPATDAARQWAGYGTALKPAWEPICLARKPLDGTNVENVLKWGVGGLNIDGCRVGEPTDTRRCKGSGSGAFPHSDDAWMPHAAVGGQNELGRFPANILHDGSDEVLAAFPSIDGGHGGGSRLSRSEYRGGGGGDGTTPHTFRDTGSAARFFYSAKADSDDRLGSKHPTVKPVDLMQWLVRLVTPKGGLVLDPFAGTGTTGAAVWREGMRAILIEREPEYQADIARRMALCLAGPEERARASIKARHGDVHAGPLFGMEPSL